MHRGMTNLDTALAYLRDHADEHLKGLDEFLRIPSISADPSVVATSAVRRSGSRMS